jgi:hypothetical protein
MTCHIDHNGRATRWATTSRSSVTPEPIELTAFELATVLAEEPVMVDGMYLVELSEAQIEDMLFEGGARITCPRTGVSLLVLAPTAGEGG